MPPAVAVTIAVPSARALTRPFSLILNTSASSHAHTTLRSVAFSGSTVAVSCISSLGSMVSGPAGVICTSLTATSARSTITTHSAVMSPAKAVIVASPAAIAVTRPVSLTVAIVLSELDHVTSLFVAFSGATVAVSCNSSPSVIVIGPSGVISTDVTSIISRATVSLQVAVSLPIEAVMIATPSSIAFTRPVASTIAISRSSLDHITLLFVAFSGDMVAVSCNSSPG